MPEFDEVRFMRKEMEGAKAAIATVGYAFVIGLISYSLTVAGVAYVAALIGFASLYGLKYLYPLLKLDVSKFDRKSWAGNGAIFLFAWLAFWILLLNPPFLDISSPVVHKIVVPGANPESPVSGGQTELSLSGNSSFEVRAQVTDNVRLAKVEMSLDGGEPWTMNPTGQNNWFFSPVTPVEADRLYTIRVMAYDHQGLQSDVFEVRVKTS